MNIKPAAQGSDALELFFEKVTVSRGKVKVLENLSFVLEPPFTVVIGANGSGKTTLIHSLLGLVEFTGNISINSQNIREFSKKKLAQTIAFVPQSFKSLPKISVRDYIILGRFPHLSWLGQFSEADVLIANQTIDRLKISHLALKMVTQISGGELRKVAIARAIVQESPILLMDEPMQGLDPFQRKEILGLIRNLLEEGKKVVIISHEQAVLNFFNPNILALKNKKVWFQGSFDELPDNWIQDLYVS